MKKMIKGRRKSALYAPRHTTNQNHHAGQGALYEKTRENQARRRGLAPLPCSIYLPFTVLSLLPLKSAQRNAPVAPLAPTFYSPYPASSPHIKPNIFAFFVAFAVFYPRYWCDVKIGKFKYSHSRLSLYTESACEKSILNSDGNRGYAESQVHAEIP